jgi:hypothetical protein
MERKGKGNSKGSNLWATSTGRTQNLSVLALVEAWREKARTHRREGGRNDSRREQRRRQRRPPASSRGGGGSGELAQGRQRQQTQPRQTAAPQRRLHTLILGRQLRDREEEDLNRGFRVHCARAKWAKYSTGPYPKSAQAYWIHVSSRPRIHI